jgi:hypothetical protein
MSDILINDPNRADALLDMSNVLRNKRLGGRGPADLARLERVGEALANAFRLLILAAVEPLREEDEELGLRTMLITAPRRFLSPPTQEALIAYFGAHLSWPPLPAPHVRQQKEVEDIALGWELRKHPTTQNWARNRHDVLAGKDGLFTAADWYPRLGGPGRTLSNHLAAFHRLVELRSITLPRVRRWAIEHQVEPYVIIDKQLGLTSRL